MGLLEQSVNTVKGIGPKKTKLLARLDINTLEDVLYYFPRDYEIHPKISSINSIKSGEMVSICGKFEGNPKLARKHRVYPS